MRARIAAVAATLIGSVAVTAGMALLPAGGAPERNEVRTAEVSGAPAPEVGADRRAGALAAMDNYEVGAPTLDPALLPAAPVTVDVLYGYTADALESAGSPAAVHTYIHRLLARTNEAMTRSRMPVQVRLAGIHAVAADAPSPMAAAMDAAKGGQGAFAGLVARRRQVGADAVQLVVGLPRECGVGQVSATRVEDAVSVVSIEECGDQDLVGAHELGHVFGATHDRGEVEHVTGQDAETLPGHNYGLVNPRARFRTVMSYGTDCPEDGYCEHVANFSNPQVMVNGAATGRARTADNADAITRGARRVSAFARPTGPPQVTFTAPEPAGFGSVTGSRVQLSFTRPIAQIPTRSVRLVDRLRARSVPTRVVHERGSSRAYLVPQRPLPRGTWRVDVRHGVLDERGQQVAATRMLFTTVPQSQLLGASPTPGQTGVAVETPVQWWFDRTTTFPAGGEPLLLEEKTMKVVPVQGVTVVDAATSRVHDYGRLKPGTTYRVVMRGGRHPLAVETPRASWTFTTAAASSSG